MTISASPASVFSTLSAASPALAAAEAPAHAPLPGLLQDRAERKAFRKAWSARVQALAKLTPRKGPSALDMAVFCLMLGKPLERAFSPVTNETKLANGSPRLAYVERTVVPLMGSDRLCQRHLSDLDEFVPVEARATLPEGFRFSARYDAGLGAAARFCRA